MVITSTSVWRVQRFDQTLNTYSNLDAAKAHGEHVIHAHYQDVMTRRRVPTEHRVIDWRIWCCGHLYGPGNFNHTAYPETHAEGCWRPTSEMLGLRPFWAASGTSAGTGHTSTAWEIWQVLAHDRFDPGTVLV
ncbi:MULTISPECIES: hypothetical protein [unclassified Streptomyces]|uniref:hypothetical protein n=1 Tax=unclassified Streptomyces TaxID=2593676 RepID=UPI0008889562|nr:MULTISPECIES: hypothetical protein [unclassified Streptomyces]PBC72232.1 hypothetical protein BX261_7314 [Streptomyces sp. 2321.6]SDR62036.1 hypothetical protein SAMN05216511_7255 [Streptomyces sp. KS_16]SEE49747.1 hypothetical protein SAMN05428940_7304 [Streptomyces sp. 2133.1]SNC77867.1 hypothetical protein SAMN06272741_7284 [Streptomyces sp. 2114.4]